VQHLVLVLAVAVSVVACANAQGDPPADLGAQPGVAQSSTSSAVSRDGDAFTSVANTVQGAGANCLVIEREGRVVGEWYWQGFAPRSLQEGFSTTKSVAATLVGIAQDEGLLSIDEPASVYITEWKGTASESVTIRHLLSNVSGRYFDVLTDYAQLAFLEQDKSGFAIALSQQNEPGERWVYNNAAVQTLEVVLERATGKSVATYAKEKLFNPLDMNSELSLDGVGNAGLFAGMQTNCRDLARVVRLYMNGGAIDNRSIVSSSFVADALAPSSDLNEAYGYLWWLNRRGLVQSSVQGSARSGVSLLAGIGEDVFYASGACGQVAMGFPDVDLVVTVMRPVDASSIAALAGCGAVNMESIVVEAIGPIVAELRK